jgi:hypothetical protein
MTNLNIQKVGAFKKASNKTAITKDVLVKRIADRVTKLKIVDSIDQESVSRPVRANQRPRRRSATDCCVFRGGGHR